MGKTDWRERLFIQLLFLSQVRRAFKHSFITPVNFFCFFFLHCIFACIISFICKMKWKSGEGPNVLLTYCFSTLTAGEQIRASTLNKCLEQKNVWSVDVIYDCAECQILDNLQLTKRTKHLIISSMVRLAPKIPCLRLSDRRLLRNLFQKTAITTNDLMPYLHCHAETCNRFKAN